MESKLSLITLNRMICISDKWAGNNVNPVIRMNSFTGKLQSQHRDQVTYLVIQIHTPELCTLATPASVTFSRRTIAAEQEV